MNKIFAIAAMALAFTACGKIDSVVNDVKSTTGMLERTVTLYNADGGVIKSWKTSNEIEYHGAVAKFIDDTGLNVRVAGTFIVEGK